MQLGTRQSSVILSAAAIACVLAQIARSRCICTRISECSALHKLRGEFAFVIWDSTHRTLFAARDRFGIKPLFYAFHCETLYFASEVKALFATGVPARWDLESSPILLNSAATRYVHCMTASQVPPGHYVIATDKHFQLNQYWDFRYPKAETSASQCSDADLCR